MDDCTLWFGDPCSDFYPVLLDKLDTSPRTTDVSLSFSDQIGCVKFKVKLSKPFSQYGSPSSMWKRLFPKGLPQAAHTKHVVCHVCRRACITSCNPKQSNYFNKNGMQQIKKMFECGYVKTGTPH